MQFHSTIRLTTNSTPNFFFKFLFLCNSSIQPIIVIVLKKNHNYHLSQLSAIHLPSYSMHYLFFHSSTSILYIFFLIHVFSILLLKILLKKFNS